MNLLSHKKAPSRKTFPVACFCYEALCRTALNWVRKKLEKTPKVLSRRRILKFIALISTPKSLKISRVCGILESDVSLSAES